MAAIVDIISFCDVTPCSLVYRTDFSHRYGYGLDDPGIESRWARDFSHLSRPTLGPTQPPAQGVPGFFRG